MDCKVLKRCLAVLAWSTLPFAATAAHAADCAEVVAGVNERLQTKQTGAMFEAGVMYEYGDCVNPDWEKATQLLQQAAQAGEARALPRLVALYAVKNRDPAAALWWAAQRPGILPKSCMPAADPQKNPAGFVNELRAWPADQLQGCTYFAGVSSRIQLEAEMGSKLNLLMNQPRTRYVAHIEVQVNVRDGSIEWYDTDEKRTVVSRLKAGSQEPDASTKPEGGDLLPQWSSGINVLKEFGLPPSTNPAWTKKTTITVGRSGRSPGLPIEVDIVR